MAIQLTKATKYIKPLKIFLYGLLVIRLVNQQSQNMMLGSTEVNSFHGL